MRHTGNRIGGSNPSLSANFLCKVILYQVVMKNQHLRTAKKPHILSARTVCKACSDRQDVSREVIPYLLTHPANGTKLSSVVCKTCLDAGVLTRVTCRTFTSVTEEASEPQGR